ncbi:MAG: WYL domain-containing protein [Ilumatobacteraceae bacterium]
MSASRLVSALLMLQRHGQITARQLADELEVSEKTARRDLEALSAAGFPVYSQAGRGGGWRLLGEARTDLTGLTADETRALFVVAGASASATPDVRAALRKLVRALPETFRDEAEAAANAVVVDPTAWGATRPLVRPDLLPELERAVIERRQVVLGYRDREQQSSERTVHPLGLVSKGNVWYLLAHTDAGARTFRISRVQSAVVTDLPAVRPADFDLADAWQSVVATVRELRTQIRVTIRLDQRHVWPLRGQFGGDLSLIEFAGDRDAPDGLVNAIIGGPSVERIAEHLAGWGAAIEVLDPPEVREHLVTIARELLARYAVTDTD